jgi:hypothetical protein
MTPKRISAWLHGLLLRFYPAEFRDEYGAEMNRDFRRSIDRRKPGSLPRLWLRTVGDWLVAMPREQWDVTRQDLRDAFRALARSPLFTRSFSRWPSSIRRCFTS